MAERGQTKRVLSAAEESDSQSDDAMEMQQTKRMREEKKASKTRVETDLERLVFGDEGTGSVFDREIDVSESADESSSGSSADSGSEDSDGDDGEASLFFTDTGGDGAQVPLQQPEEPGSETGSEDEEAAAAWEDDGMDQATVKLKAKSRTRKLRAEEGENKVSGSEYERRLREQFEKIHPVPQWAETTEEGVEARPGESLLQTSASLVARSRAALPAGILDISRTRNANQQGLSQAVVRSVQFHPTASVVLTAGMDKTLRLFEVDGKENQKVQSVFFKDLPITTAQFTRAGAEIVATGRRGFYYSVDVQRGTAMRVNGIPGHRAKSLEFMRAGGDRLAFLANSGQIHLVSARTKQFVHTLPMNGAVRDVAFTNDGNYLWSVGLDNDIYQWDLRTNQCVSRWHDTSSFRPTCLSISPNSSYYACGDDAGVVNIYDASKPRGEPIKEIRNLTTSILGTRFNHSSELLAIYSRRKAGQLRLVHLPSATVISNWPSQSSSLGTINCVDFSPNSGFMAVGNDAGRALLYRLQHYASY
ncbi:U3 snoRNP protein [Coemansia sp. RSA 552]|nr:U3 snoRNP protein [Coemansia sp. RSA 552]